MKRSIYILFMVLCFYVQGQETLGTLTGTVQDATGNPLAYASVLIENLRLGVLTDNKGRYSIGKLPSGKPQRLGFLLGLRYQLREH